MSKQKKANVKNELEYSDSFIKFLLCRHTLLEPEDIPNKLVKLKRKCLILEKTITNNFMELKK